MTNNVIKLHKVTEEALSPREYLNLKSSESRNISHTEVIPPRLGEKDFGSIRVVYKNPVYK